MLFRCFLTLAILLALTQFAVSQDTVEKQTLRKRSPPRAKKHPGSPISETIKNDTQTVFPVLARDLVAEARALEPRQYCDPGYGYCSNSGYCCPGNSRCCDDGNCQASNEICCNSGGKCYSNQNCCGDGCIPDENVCCGTYQCDSGEGCCDSGECAPLDAECCKGGGYCDDGLMCVLWTENGVQDVVCCIDLSCSEYDDYDEPDYVDSDDDYDDDYDDYTSVPEVTAAPTATWGSDYESSYGYYTWYITYYYWSYYWEWYAVLTKSTTTSTLVTTTTTVSIYATNSAEASSSFEDFSATVSLYTPVEATSVPTLTDSQTTQSPSDSGDSGDSGLTDLDPSEPDSGDLPPSNAANRLAWNNPFSGMTLGSYVLAAMVVVPGALMVWL